MFTGIVERSHIKEVIKNEEGAELKIKSVALLDAVKIGDSVAVDGTCLTVNAIEADWIGFFASNETLSKTIVSSYQANTSINVELPLKPTDFLGGHYVLGHVDTIGTVTSVEKGEKSWILYLEVPQQFDKYIVYKGSIAINGVSLTVNQVNDGKIELCIIPVTLSKTNLGELTPGKKVNLEFDILAKYTEKLLGNKK